MEVEGQSYIYYQKGSLVMFALQDAIGEQRLNDILKGYIDSVRFAGPTYTIMPQFYNRLTRNLNAIETAQVDDFIKKITVYKNKMVSAKGKPKGKGQYEITFVVETAKFYADSTGIENPVPNYFPIDIGLLAKKDVTAATDLLHIEKRMLKPKETFTLTTNKKAAYAGIDPLHKLVDANSGDNLISIEWEEK
jgi:aminopeptidase N